MRSAPSSSPQWKQLVSALQRENADGFRAYVVPVDDPRWYRLSVDALRASVPVTEAQVLFVADELTLAAPEFPVLAIDLRGSGRAFRCIATELWSVENNLNLANMGWQEFAALVDSQGVYRGLNG
ncbi:hypothetical protein OH146_11875 [Salinibacterium sp. SYSU T00001]|nr:hypothetical protein [Salinibacterium sedimenticola]